MGYPKAFLNLGVCYEKGKIVAQDTRKASSLFKRGAAKGDEDCKLFWVYNLLNSRSGTEDDWVLAHQYCLEAIALDSEKPESYYFLGIFN